MSGQSSIRMSCLAGRAEDRFGDSRRLERDEPSASLPDPVRSLWHHQVAFFDGDGSTSGSAGAMRP